MPSTVRDVDWLHFAPAFMERIWGGRRLADALGFALPPRTNVGEAWLLADHPVHESVVANGPLAGSTLRDLMLSDAEGLIGTAAQAAGRFPLLLKILDARDDLSVQVHPDDALARVLGEADGGKTEMWHVWDALPGSRLVCGLAPGVTRETLARAIADDAIEDLLVSLSVAPGDSVFVPAGTVHAIGAGVLLSEIQQNSDITYRLYDYGRRDAEGNLRELHIEKSLRAVSFAPHSGVTRPAFTGDAALLAECPYFACRLVKSAPVYIHDPAKRSFVILLAKEDGAVLRTARGETSLPRAHAVLVPAHVGAFEIAGTAPVLLHYVP